MDNVMNASKLQTIYIAIGGAAGTALEEVATSVLVEDDNLLTGPSSTNLLLHHEMRERHCGYAPSTDLDEELARKTGPLLCVYLPPTPSGLLSLCRICDLALTQDRRVSVIELEPEWPHALSEGGDPGQGIYSAEKAIQQPRPPAAPWSKLQTSFAAALWQMWCQHSPVTFSRSCAMGIALHPQIVNLGRFHAGFFPRQSAQGFLLSRVDELILRQLSREWLTPGQIFLQAVEMRSELPTWLGHTGDQYLAERLFLWALDTDGRIVERRQPPKADSEADLMTDSLFRWHAGAEAILSSLPSLKVAPPLEIGGAVAYDPNRPWLSRADSTLGSYVTKQGASLHALDVSLAW